MMELWPFTNFHDLNLDWIIKTILDWVKKMQNFIDNMTADWKDMRDDWQEFIDSTYKEQITEILEDHPEWTTTVMDGALTEPKYATGSVSTRALENDSVTADKMSSEVLYYKTPEMFGAVGDGVTDDTAALNACMAGGGVIKFENGKTYKVTPFINFGMAQADLAGVKIQSHSYIDMNGATITCNVNEASWYSLVNIDGVEDVHLINGKIIGEYEDRVSTNGEQGFGVYIANSDQITLENLDVSYCHGDAFIIYQYNTNVRIKDCTGRHCARQGLSIIGGQELTIDGCVFHDIIGKSPESGVDIEGYPEDLPGNIILRNLLVYNTNGPCLKVLDSAYNVLIDSCELRKPDNLPGTVNARDVSFKIVNTAFRFTDMTDSTIDIENCDVYRGTADVLGCNLNIEHSNFHSDTTIWIRGQHAVWKFQHCNIYQSGTAQVFNMYGQVDGGLEIQNCNVVALDSSGLMMGNNSSPGGRVNITNSYLHWQGSISAMPVNTLLIANSYLRMNNTQAGYGIMTLYNTDVRITDTYIRRNYGATYLFANTGGSAIKTSNVTLEDPVTNIAEGTPSSMHNNNLCNGLVNI